MSPYPRRKKMTKIRELFSSRSTWEYIISGIIFIAVSILLIYAAHMRDAANTVSIDNPQTYDAVVESTKDPVITLEEAAEVKSLEFLSHKGLDDLSELEEFTGLEELTISGCTMDSLDGIENFKHLQKLIVISTTLDANALVDADLKELKVIQITNGQISDVQKLIDNYPDLEILVLRDTSASGKIVVKDMPFLTRLELRSDDITDLKLDNLPSLTEANFDKTLITDIDGMLGITSIEKLVLTFTPLSDINGISSLNNLKEIRLQGTEVTDLDELSEIDSFNSIYLDKWFDRSRIEFLRDHFREGDIYTKIYFLGDLS